MTNKGRNSIIYNIGKIFLKFPFELFKPIDRIIGSKKQSKRLKAIFIIGLPRSGTTLTYQAFCHSFNSVYISNFSNLIYKLPYISTHIASKPVSRYTSDFISNRGFINGIFSPAEGFRFWKYWFGNTLKESETSILQQKEEFESNAESLKNILRNLSADNVFISSYIGHIVGLDALINKFPDAVFIKLTRNPEDIIYSILRELDDIDEDHLGTEVNICHAEKGDKLIAITQQVVAQQKILSKLDSLENVFEISYENLTERPKEIMDNFFNKFHQKLDLSFKRGNHLPKSFQKRINKDSARAKDIALAIKKVLKK